MENELVEHFFKVSSLYLEARIRIRIRIKVTCRIRIRIRIKVTSRILISNTGSKKAYVLLFSVLGDLASGIPGCLLSCMSRQCQKTNIEFSLTMSWYGIQFGT
jgi:hypothetical protein